MSSSTVYTYTDWKKQLNCSGVPDRVIDIARMHSSDNQRVYYPCSYPPVVVTEGNVEKVVYPSVERYRSLPEFMERNPRQRRFGNPPKDKLPDGKMPVIYTPDFKWLRSNVSKHGGVLKLFEGDKDTWTAWAAGWLNAAGVVSASMPIGADFVRALHDLGVKHIDFYPDRDFSGISLAEKLMDLDIPDVTLNIYGLPLFVEEKQIKDATDVWLAVNQSPRAYTSLMSSLPKMRLATRRQRDFAQGNDYFIQELYDDIENEYAVRAGGSVEYKAGGFADTPIVCPFHSHEHDDVRPAFYWNRVAKLGYCHKPGETYLAKEVAEAFGINWRDYINRDSDDNLPPSIRTTDAQIQKVSDKKSEPSPTLLNVGMSHMQSIAPLVGEYDKLTDDKLLFTLDDALDDYTKRLSGETSSQYPPIENPVKLFHQLGGNGRVIMRPCMLGVLGVSGGFKTSFLTWIANVFALKGYNVIVWSPEWSPERNADRVIQQHGGMKMWEMRLHERYLYEKSAIERGEMNPDDSSIFGVKTEQEKIHKTEFALQKVRRNFKGKVVYLRDFSPSIYHLAAQILSVHRRMTEAGRQPEILIVDYAQMATAPSDSYRWSMEDTITVLKQVTLSKGFATFVASQVRKSDTESVMGSDDFLGSTAGLNFRDHQFNFFWTVSPVPVDKDSVVLDNGDVRHILNVAVTKNSDGETRKSRDDLLKFYVDTDRMQVMDTPYYEQSTMLYSMNDDPDWQDDGESVGNHIGLTRRVGDREDHTPEFLPLNV